MGWWKDLLLNFKLIKRVILRYNSFFLYLYFSIFINYDYYLYKMREKDMEKNNLKNIILFKNALKYKS